ncbi:Golgi apparatus membrane protein TVP15 [Kockiozyma suomiensis]|uniref:Golgi apparatus membrane protein TVP15 n=1 Tax=Kockiozyma suomiensis TaxID=1337062 RepID=UPI003343BC52
MALFDYDSFASPFRIVNLVIGALMILGGFSSFFPLGFRSVILGLYTVLFGSLVVAAEFSMPTQIAQYASFLLSFLGRGMFYILVGAFILGPGPLRIVGGAVILLVGAIYVVLEFTPSIEPPTNMRGEDNGYEAAYGETV